MIYFTIYAKTKVMSKDSSQQTHFGFQSIQFEQKQDKVNDVFHTVASKYDLMNDLMSCGLHRFWKDYAVNSMCLHKNDHVLDLAGGTADLSNRILKKLAHSSQLCLADYNHSMLKIGRKNLHNAGYLSPVVVADGHSLPFPEGCFDHIIVGFGLRNMADQCKALESMYKTLKNNGKLTVLEFTTPTNPLFEKIYDWYSFNLIPQIGAWITASKESYEYLVESIRMHPKAPELQHMFENVGFSKCSYEYLSQGIVAIHQGVKQ
tara:strand:+ start:830 stop:1615 length:786 start_codon:yes stop_codon:yes gene_type:complete